MKERCDGCGMKITIEESKEYRGFCYNCFFGIDRDSAEVENE
jgi:hypothetical protein